MGLRKTGVTEILRYAIDVNDHGQSVNATTQWIYLSDI